MDRCDAPLGFLTMQAAQQRLFLPLMVLAVLALYYLVDPATHSLFPPCIFNRITGWLCPGCGGQRALHALLHGDPRAAFALNPLIFLAIPLVGLLIVREFLPTKLDLPSITPLRLLALVAFLVLFALFRNLT